MRKIKITENPYLLFSPFLIVSLILVFLFRTNCTYGDEGKYISFATNILHGYFSPPAPGIDLANGPGYPILLVPFIAMRLPLVCITIMNAVFYYFSIILLYKILQQFVSKQVTIIFSLFWACYINSYEYIFIIYSEIFTIFLILIIVFCLVREFNSESVSGNKKYLFLSGFFIGYLALTKPIFGYVLLFLLVGCGLLWIIDRKIANYKKAVITLLFALATTTPYLIYTYNLTGKIFYWSTLGGNNLYWMSTPFEKEYGSWYEFHNFDIDSTWKANLIPGGEESFKSDHRKDFEEIFKYVGVAQDEAYKKIAINNIKSHPVKFVQNCISNLGRMVFNFPYSYKVQTPKTLLRLPFNGIIVVLMLFCLIPTFLNWRKIPFSIQFMLFLVFLYFGGSTLGSAETRMFSAIVPMLLIWIAFIIDKSIIFKLKFD
jgi:4-amino-4-deoxy-L-arabinose transferase-like glycosyltransferase